MKASDAKAPKFEAKWWTANKAKDADPRGDFAKALDAYAQARTGVKSRPFEIQLLVSKLTAVGNMAKQVQADKKLGLAQKETRDALSNYEKMSAAALTRIKNLPKDATFVACADKDAASGTKKLIKQESKAFRAWLARGRTEEGFDFLCEIERGRTDKKTYLKHIAPSAPKQININDTLRNAFDAKAGEANPVWDPKLWDAVYDLVFRELKEDAFARFKAEYPALLWEQLKLP